MKTTDGKIRLSKRDAVVGDFVVTTEKEHYRIQTTDLLWSLRVGRESNIGRLCAEGLKDMEGDGLRRILTLLRVVTEQLPMTSPVCCETVSECMVQAACGASIGNGRPCVIHSSEGDLVARVLTALQALNVWLDEGEMRSIVSVLESNYRRNADVYNPSVDDESEAMRLAEQVIINEELEKLVN